MKMNFAAVVWLSFSLVGAGLRPENSASINIEHDSDEAIAAPTLHINAESVPATELIELKGLSARPALLLVLAASISLLGGVACAVLCYPAQPDAEDSGEGSAPANKISKFACGGLASAGIFLVLAGVMFQASRRRSGAIAKAQSKGPGDPDYDCDQDGGNECGDWSYSGAKCANSVWCDYKYKWGDWLLDHSCRCKPEMQKVTLYDCDGDGTDDCGDWDYGKVQCNHGHKCGYAYEFGDYLLDHSCRCKPECLGPENMKSCQPEMTDYDCDGDGAEDCGSWDYGSATCQKLEMCGYDYKFGDISLDASCRCRPCAKTNSHTAASADKNLVPDPNPSVVGSTGYWARWINWADHIDTCAPWMMPTNDGDLQSLLTYAKAMGYHVRPSGAGHSAGGLVTDGADDTVMVVSLGGYHTTGDWEFSLDASSKKMKVNAGFSQLDVYERIRPQHLFFPSQTAGYFFQIAGVVANSVHGAGYQNSFINSYVTRMRVMLHDGTIKIIDDKDELRYWRNSYGLLGLILGVEMQLEERQQYQMYTKTRSVEWTEENYWSFIFDDAEADLPAEITGGVRAEAGSRKSIGGEFFINVLPDKPEFLVYANKANENATEPGVPSDMPAKVVANYKEVREEQVKKFEHNGWISFGESARKEGCPNFYIDALQKIEVNKIVGTGLVDTIAQVIEPLSFAATTLTQLPGLIKTQRDRSNDGFFAMKAPNTLIAAYFIKPERSFEAMDFVRKRQLARNGQATWFNADGFSWNQPVEFRLINVDDAAVLSPVPPGLWFVSEILAFPDSAATDQEWKKAFKEIEDYWINQLGAVPHLGKLFAFEEENGQLEVFHQSRVCKVYSSAKKTEFKDYQQKMDPDGLFNHGLGEKLLREC